MKQESAGKRATVCRGQMDSGNFVRSAASDWRRLSAATATLYIVQIILLLGLGWINQDTMNADGVGYIRTAIYYHTNQSDLMVSGYWGPLIIWLTALLLSVISSPVMAAKVAVAISSIVFLFGCRVIFSQLRLEKDSHLYASWIAMILSVSWSVLGISPDLLMSGLLCLGLAVVLSDAWTKTAAAALGAGAILGCAYLAKAPALPIALLAIAALSVQHVLVRQVPIKTVLRSGLLSLAMLLIIAAPWIGVLSQKYGHLTFSTSGPINHALSGPLSEGEAHPSFTTFHKPEPGRVTSWEDPSTLSYDYWNPLESLETALYQMKSIYRNFNTVVLRIKGFDWFGLGLASCILAYLVAWPWRKAHQGERWRWSIVPVAAIGVVFLPVYVHDSRYFFSAFPFLLAASFGFVGFLLARSSASSKVLRTFAFLLLAFSFLYGNASALAGAVLQNYTNSFRIAKAFHQGVTAAGLEGPIASLGQEGGSGLYLAFLLGQPWYGQESKLDAVDQVLASDAKLFMTVRESDLSAHLHQQGHLTLITRELLGCKDLKDSPPVDVFAVRDAPLPAPCPH